MSERHTDETIADYGFFRVAAAVPVCALGNPAENARRIVDLATRAAEGGAGLVVFPELSLTGYTVGDLFLQRRLEESVRSAADFLLRNLPPSIVTVAGAPWRCEGKLFNTALIFGGGRLRGIVPKTFLPNYKEFYEKRWFVSGAQASEETAGFNGDKIPFGTGLLFHVNAKPDVRLGVEICEDLWVPAPPSSFQALAGAQILVNLSASDETIGKSDYRRQHLVAAQSARCIAGLVFVSSGPGESSSDLVFGGHTLIAENGIVLAEEKRIQEEPRLTMADIDIDRLGANRDRMGSFADAAAIYPRAFRIIETCATASAPLQLQRHIEPHPFVPADAASLDSRCEEISAIQAAGLQQRLRHLSCPRPVLGISGGLDSALAALVCARALRELNRPSVDLLAISMPGTGTSARTRANAQKLARALEADFREIEIENAVALHLKAIGHGGKPDIAFENAQARERTQILMDIGNQDNGIVIGTGDLSEIALGWSTYGGDHLSMYDVNASVPKTLLRHVVAWMARRSKPELRSVLTDILETPVSPELLPAGGDGHISQKTEEILGPFELLDFFLYHLVREGFTPKKILFLARYAFANRFSEAVIITTLRTFLRRFFAAQFKRNAMPDGPKVGTVALSPRGDWRMPADIHPDAWLEGLPE